ncbi:MAG: hypothetical protein KAW19_01170 [Candidatus Aminicenantes bacterium]|nr:hypothetical protein [Candidatus Aminicenantes bacterium]
MGEGQGRFNLGEDNKIRSALDLHRDLKAPKEIDGEKVLMNGQAAYDAGNFARSTWKMGRLFLTKDKLSFFQGQNRILEILIGSLGEIEVIERNWIPAKKVEQLRLTREEDGIKRIFHLSVRNADQWKKTIEAAEQKTKGKETC